MKERKNSRKERTNRRNLATHEEKEKATGKARRNSRRKAMGG